MADAGAFVHGCARDAHAQITQLSDFVSPTIVAMWNLRWQVQGFIAAYPEAKQTDLVQRFALGSNMKGNEIKRACIENSWSEQKSRFASVLLTNTISIFEDFVERLAGMTLTGDAKRRAYKGLQYPQGSGGRCYIDSYNAMGAPVAALAGVFKPLSGSSRWYSGPKLENLLLCYRFFKEVRNALSHNGGMATTELCAAYQNFIAIATTADLGVKEVPAHTAPALSQKISLDLRGAYGFSDIVLRIIATYDLDLSDRPSALAEMNHRLGRIEGPARARVEQDKRTKRINGLLRRAYFPAAVHTQGFISHLKSTGRIPDYW